MNRVMEPIVEPLGESAHINNLRRTIREAQHFAKIMDFLMLLALIYWMILLLRHTRQTRE